MILSGLNQIRNIKSKEDKAYFLDQLADQGEMYKKLLVMIFDKDVRYFADTKKIQGGLSGVGSFYMKPENELDQELFDLLTMLASEELRGKVANQKCIDFAEQLMPDEIDMFLNVLENKTRLRIGPTDINKLCKKFSIDQYEVMFAKRVDDISDIEWYRTYYMQPKIDGNRCINEKEQYHNEFLTRTGKPLTSVNFLKDQFNEAFGDNTFVTDGEIESGKTLEESGALRRKSEQAENVVYTLFGIYKLDEWRSKNHVETYDQVYARTKRMLEEHPMANVRLIPSYKIEAKTEEEFYSTLMKYYQEFLDLGYEGGVLKTEKHVYQPSAGTRRSKDWIKLKPKESTEGTIVDIIEGEGEHKGMLGKFVIKWLDVTFEVSPGKINHKDRKFIMEHPDDFKGHQLEFVYQVLSKYGVPRTASAIKVRKDK